MRLTDYDHVNMLKNPGRWPRWPILPMKSYRNVEPGRMPNLAVAIEGPDGKVRLFADLHLGMYEFIAKVKAGEYNTMAHEVLTPEEIVARGWVVD